MVFAKLYKEMLGKIYTLKHSADADENIYWYF